MVVARIWGSKGPGPVWEAVFTTKSETGDFAAEKREVEELILEVVEAVADQLPVKPVPRGVMGGA